MWRLKLCAVLLLELGLTGLQAQESVNATGGSTTGSGGSVSYSVGQIVYQAHTGTSGSVMCGVQQVYEISVVTTIEEAKGIDLSVMAYPNPTTDFLLLKVEGNNLKDLSFQLYSMSGKILQIKNISGTETQFDMSNYASSIYFVRIIQGNKEVKTFKIIKK